MLSNFGLSLRCMVSPTLVITSYDSDPSKRASRSVFYFQPAWLGHCQYASNISALSQEYSLKRARRAKSLQLTLVSFPTHYQSQLQSPPQPNLCLSTGSTMPWRSSRGKGTGVQLIGGLFGSSYMNFSMGKLHFKDWGIQARCLMQWAIPRITSYKLREQRLHSQPSSKGAIKQASSEKKNC